MPTINYGKKVNYQHGKWKSENIQVAGGNKALGKIPSISLAPILSCINYKYCSKECYSKKAFRLFPQSRIAWTKNYLLCINRLNIVEKELTKLLEKNNPEYFRFHINGDIISRKHFNTYIRIAKQFSNTQFLIYTKAFIFIPNNADILPDNFKVILSLWTNLKKPYHKKNYIFSYFEDKNNLDNRIAKDNNKFYCPKIDNKNLTCEKCLVCFRQSLKKNVVFKKH